VESITVEHFYTSNKTKIQLYLGSDDHMMGQDFDEESWTKYMKEAQEKEAKIFKFGDTFGGINPRDPRFTARTMEEAMHKDWWADAAVDDAFERHAPFVNSIYGLGIGNHEYTVLVKNGTNLIMRLIGKLNDIRDRTLPPIYYLGYCGFIRLKFIQAANSNNSNSSCKIHRYVIAYHHGTSTNAPVTEGIIAAKRFFQNLEGVDCIAMGHVHKNWSVRNERFYLDQKGNIKIRSVRLVQTGTHQQSYTEPGIKDVQWSEAKAFPPAPMGGVFLKLELNSKNTESPFEVRIEH